MAWEGVNFPLFIVYNKVTLYNFNQSQHKPISHYEALIGY